MCSAPFSVCVPVTIAVSPLMRTRAESVVKDAIENERHNSIVCALSRLLAVLVRFIEPGCENLAQCGRVLFQFGDAVGVVHLHKLLLNA